MARPTTAPVRKQVSLPPNLAQAVDEYRFANRLSSESEAIRRLIQVGLEASNPAAERGIGGHLTKAEG
jgi:metal-responsive CopG/Arc/MetJ family transcriptional regulator